MLNREEPIAIYMQGATQTSIGKMGFGVLRYSANPIACVIDSEQAGRDAAELTGIPRSAPVVSNIREAKEQGAKVLLLGIAPQGGLIPADWYPVIEEAIAEGMSVINGLHDLLSHRYQTLNGQYVWDIRVEPKDIGVASGAAQHLPNKRVLMIGTDMAVGKMTAGLEIYRGLREHGISTEFVATGQIGITITGRGIPLDAIRVDYAAGAMEKAVLEASEDGTEVVIIEGQGALCHPGSTANLPLLRGSMPTHLVLCHRAGQTHLQKMEDIKIPPLGDYIRLYEDLASAGGTFPRPVTVGIALNTSHLDDHAAICAMAQVERETGLMTCDPVRYGPDRLVNNLVGLTPKR